jgi:hypothetical protein
MTALLPCAADVPRADDPKVYNAARAMAKTLRALECGLGLSADEAVVAAYVALSALAGDASLPVRAWLASACSLMDAENADG